MRRVVIVIDDAGMASMQTDLDMPNTLLLLHKIVLDGVPRVPVNVRPSGVEVATPEQVPPVPQNRTSGKG